MDDMDLSVFSLDLGDKHTDNAPVSAPDDTPKPTPTNTPEPKSKEPKSPTVDTPVKEALSQKPAPVNPLPEASVLDGDPFIIHEERESTSPVGIPIVKTGVALDSSAGDEFAASLVKEYERRMSANPAPTAPHIAPAATPTNVPDGAAEDTPANAPEDNPTIEKKQEETETPTPEAQEGDDSLTEEPATTPSKNKTLTWVEAHTPEKIKTWVGKNKKLSIAFAATSLLGIIALIVMSIPTGNTPDDTPTGAPDSTPTSAPTATPKKWGEEKPITNWAFNWDNPAISPAPQGYGENQPEEATKTGKGEGYHWARMWGNSQAGGDLLITFPNPVTITSVSITPGIIGVLPSGKNMWDTYRHPGKITIVCNPQDVGSKESLAWWNTPWAVNLPRTPQPTTVKLDTTPNKDCVLQPGEPLLISFHDDWATEKNPTFAGPLTKPGEEPCCSPDDQVAVSGLTIVGKEQK